MAKTLFLPAKNTTGNEQKTEIRKGMLSIKYIPLLTFPLSKANKKLLYMPLPNRQYPSVPTKEYTAAQQQVAMKVVVVVLLSLAFFSPKLKCPYL